MKRYTVQVDKHVVKFFRKLPLKHAVQLHEALRRLEINPRPQDSKKLVDSDGYRVTVGEYRILYIINDSTASVEVYAIAKRNDLSYG
jgi:mRNA interferase RelE/StbE